jgi:hypothetical protein
VSKRVNWTYAVFLAGYSIVRTDGVYYWYKNGSTCSALGISDSFYQFIRHYLNEEAIHDIP